MVLQLTPVSQGGLCHGNSWEVIDRDSLVYYLALAALGRARHAYKILAGDAQLQINQRAFASAIKKFDLTSGNDPFHRDGWMFQVISWLAANITNPGTFVTAPHIIRADKGLDGLLLELNSATTEIMAAVVFEDKATTNPRNTIRDDVWPELKSFEDGERDDGLTDGVSALLQTAEGLDAEDVVNKVIWERILKYRVSITIGGSHNRTDGYARLFDGYDQVVTGSDDRRRGEVFYCQDMRQWMKELAADCVAKLETMRSQNV